MAPMNAAPMVPVASTELRVILQSLLMEDILKRRPTLVEVYAAFEGRWPANKKE